MPKRLGYQRPVANVREELQLLSGVPSTYGDGWPSMLRLFHKVA